MKTAPLPPDEESRLSALNNYEVLDTFPEQDFDDLTFLASHICKTPIALISLVDHARQWFKSKVGLDAIETPKEVAFCSHAILQKDVFIVPDSFKDERFHDNPLATGAPHVRFYAGAPLQTPSGQNIGTLCVIDSSPRDLTQDQIVALQTLARQVVSQLELRRQNISMLRTSQLMENSPAAMFCKDYKSGKGVFVDWNKTAENLWGLKKEAILGKTDYDLFEKSQADFFREKDLETIKSGKPLSIEQEPIDTQDKGHLELRTWKVPVNDQDGKPRYLLGISLDITRQVELERQLKAAKEQAENATRTKSLFLANMSHEIRTPMNGIIGMTNLLLGSITDPSHVERLKIIQNCGNSLLDLINDVLDFSKLEVDKVELEKQPFPLHSTVKEVAELFSTRASEKGITLSYRHENDIPFWLIGDITRFRQVLTNLVSNAIKFTEIGSVEISSQASRIDEKKWTVQFSVKDTGTGIPKEVSNKLFLSFSQVDASTTRRFGGSGLGLAICKGLCEKMGGSIWVDSEPGKGSTFSFSLQAEECKALQSEAPANPFVGLDPEMGKKHPLRILVAEDNRTNQLVAVGLLGKLGYIADVAGNGRETLNALRTQQYDLILMDCHMPEMDGFEATRRVTDMYGSRRPKIVALTASTMKEDIDQCTASGMDGFLGKPITIPPLVKMLSECQSTFKEKAA